MDFIFITIIFTVLLSPVVSLWDVKLDNKDFFYGDTKKNTKTKSK